MSEPANNNSSSDNNHNSHPKAVQVYILLGQSNMLGMGKVNGDKEGFLPFAVHTKKKYPYLIDENGNWTVSSNVRNVRVMGSGTGPMKVHNNEWMTVTKEKKIGPELGIGHFVGNPQLVEDDGDNKNAYDTKDSTEHFPPVLLIKSCIGNRSLGWDLLPPGSLPFEYEEVNDKGEKTVWRCAGYKESPDKWVKGTEPKPIGWYAGMQYDGDIANVKTVLQNLDTYYPRATNYEIVGFFWWQGDKDRYNPIHACHYEKNLVHLIRQLRNDFDAPNAKFVCATLGQTNKETATGVEKQILDAQLAVDGTSSDPKYSDFKGNVATVYSHPLCHGGASNSHYNGHAETFTDIGEAMGLAMIKLLQEDFQNGK